MRNLFFALVCLLTSATLGFAQTYQGPAFGSIPSGVTISTSSFRPESPTSYQGPVAVKTHNKLPVFPLPAPADMPPPSAQEGSNYIEYHPTMESIQSAPPPITLKSFQGIPQTNSIPPDPHLAVGPDHIITVVNSQFRISDKSGTTLKTINANSWFASVLPGVGAFDPKVIYDHHAGRWVMVWLDLNTTAQTSWFLISVSEGSSALGTWYNWALPSNRNGSTPTSDWTDYQGVGFDKDAIYITGNQFSFSSIYQYVKLRVIGKAQLYANTAGSVTWTDMWDLRDAFGNGVFGMRPSISYTSPNEYYLIGKPNFTTGSYFALYRLINPLTTPSISVVHVPVTGWSNAPNANQLGGSSTLIEGGTSHVRNEPIYSDSSLWLVHSVASGSGNQSSSVRYVRINTLTNAAVEDVAFGAEGFWHFYTGIAVDKDKNVAISFSRSGLSEYVGAYFTWRLSTDGASLRPISTMQTGKSNYLRVASGRNRWGDYNGIALDPADRNNFWMFTEYAAAGNSWATWTHGMRVVPFPGARITSTSSALAFGSVEAGSSSDTLSLTLHNMGVNTLNISSITKSLGSYTILNPPAFPANLSTYDSLRLRILFRPTVHGNAFDTLRIASNDGITPTTKVALNAKGVVITKAVAGVMYAASASQPISQLYSLSTTNAVATPIGQTGITEVHGLAIRPSSKELYGTFSTPDYTTIYRVSAAYGDALEAKTIPLGYMRAIAFDSAGTLYGGTTTGALYRINLTTGDTTFVGVAAGIAYSGLSFHPTTGVLWGSVRTVLNRDRIFTVNTTTGAATLVGNIGDNLITPYIAFDAYGTLYALKGSSSQINSLLTLNQATGAGTSLGSAGVEGLMSIAIRTDSLTSSVEEIPSQGIPTEFVLNQNYPNPFNPTTTIYYGIPSQSHVRLSIYDVMGQEVIRLIDQPQSSGYYNATWQGTNSAGISAASGVYFYKLTATGNNGREFVSQKKMLFVK